MKNMVKIEFNREISSKMPLILRIQGEYKAGCLLNFGIGRISGKLHFILK